MLQSLSVFRDSVSERRYLAAYDAILARWPVPFESVEIPTRFGSTHVLVSGPPNAPPLLLLPGNFESSIMWFRAIECLSTGNRVFALDTIGDVGKSVTTCFPANRDDYANWLEDVVDGLGLTTVTLIGLSFGGFLAANFALKQPDRVQRLVLLCPGLPFAPFTFQWLLRGAPMIILPTPLTVRWFVNGATNRKAQGDMGIDAFVTGVTGLRSTRVMHPSLTCSELSKLNMPILLLIGQREILYDSATAIERARQLIPQIHAEVIQGASHFLLFDQPEKVNQAVLRFLNSSA